MRRPKTQPVLITLHAPDGTPFSVDPKKVRKLEVRDADDREAVWKSIGVAGRSRLVLPGGVVYQASETVEEIRELIAVSELKESGP